MSKEAEGAYWAVSFSLHVLLLLVLVVSFQWNMPAPVLENSDTIVMATVLSLDKVPPKRIAPKPVPAPVANDLPQKEKPQPPDILPKPLPIKPKTINHDTQKQLLADINSLKKQTELKKKEKRKKDIQSQLEKEIQSVKANALAKQMQSEQQKIKADSMSAKMRGIVDKYKALILAAIGQNWLVPPNVDKKLTTELLIRVAPGGMVLDVQLLKSSGDPALDRSARLAVMKASPLPVPSDPEEFGPFRQFVLKVRPENVLSNDAPLMS